MDRLAYTLAQLSPRERGLLLALCLVGLPVALYFFAVLPVVDARAAAARSAAEAEAMRGWVAEQVAALPPEGLEAPADTAGTPNPIGLSGIEQSLMNAGLRDRVTQLANAQGGGVELEFDAVEFDRLVGWLHDTAPGWGYDVAGFRIARDEPGLVIAGFTLDPAE